MKELTTTVLNLAPHSLHCDCFSLLTDRSDSEIATKHFTTSFVLRKCISTYLRTTPKKSIRENVTVPTLAERILPENHHGFIALQSSRLPECSRISVYDTNFYIEVRFNNF
jgi:hypothetical protein